MKRVAAAAAVVALCAGAAPVLAGGDSVRGQSGLAAARQATARYHHVTTAEAHGYESTLDSLGCFENPGVGGMGLHFVNFDLLDDVVEVDRPEALVYEMAANGKLKLVALEYIVPSDLVDSANPPSLFGHTFHAHPVLPLHVLHAWIWAPNPDGMFADWNRRVGRCPAGVPVFGS
jgi:hypothetical protein